MKIKETIERDCCHWKDLDKYHGKQELLNVQFKFCRHCGQIWRQTSEMGAAGSSDPCLELIVVRLPED